MEISKELRQTFFNKINDIQSMDIEYSNGEVISGFPKRIKPSPFVVQFQESVFPRGQSGLRYLDFDEVKNITVFYNDGSEEILE